MLFTWICCVNIKMPYLICFFKFWHYSNILNFWFIKFYSISTDFMSRICNLLKLNLKLFSFAFWKNFVRRWYVPRNIPFEFYRKLLCHQHKFRFLHIYLSTLPTKNPDFDCSQSLRQDVLIFEIAVQMRHNYLFYVFDNIVSMKTILFLKSWLMYFC